MNLTARLKTAMAVVSIFFVCWSPLQVSAGVQTAPQIRIGAVFSLTGIAALHNRPLVEMLELTVSEVNAGGGVMGRQVELLLFDNKSTPIGSVEAANEALEADVSAVIGAHWSSHSLAMAPVLQKAGVPMITPASTHPDVTIGKDYIFRTCFNDSAQGAAMARFAHDSLKVKTTAILRNIDEKYSMTLASFYGREFIRLGGEVLLYHNYRSNSTDYSTVIAELKRLQPETVYFPGYTRDTALFMQQAREYGVHAVFLGGDGWDMLEQIAADAVEGSYQSVHWHHDVPFPESARVIAMYEQTDEAAIHNLTTPLVYDTFMLLAKAIEAAGSSEPDAVRAALETLPPFSGATGTIHFDEEGNPGRKDVIIVHYAGGKVMYETSVTP